jgi:hypothetical protein
MRLNEFSSPFNKYLVTVKVHGTSVKTMIHAESQSHARLLLGKMFGKDNVQSINSISTNESQTTISLNLQEAVSADDLLSLWQIVSQNVFTAIEKERREAEEAQRLEASKPKRSRAVRSPSRSVSAVKAVRPKAVKPQVAKPQASKTQAAAPQSVSKQQSPQMTQQPRTQTQTQTQARPQQTMMPRAATFQPTRRTPQIAQPLSQQQQIAQVNRKLSSNVLPI